MNDLEYSHKIEWLYRRIFPNLQFDADSIRLHPQECLEDGLSILYALGIIQTDDISRMTKEYSFGPCTLREYIDTHGTSSIDEYIRNLQCLINDHLKTAEDSSSSFVQKESAPMASPDVETNEQKITAEDIPLTEDGKETPMPAKPKFTKKKIVIWGIIVIAVIAAVIAIAVAFPHESTFERVKSECVHIAGIVTGGGDHFTIDTYPDEFEALDPFVVAPLLPALRDNALEAIRYANEQLGFNGSVYSKMIETTALMGRQSEENNKYRVSWTYHPDDGLKVTYEKK